MSQDQLLSLRDLLREKLSKADISAILAELKTRLPEYAAKQKEVLVLETQFNKFKQEERQGVLSREEMDLIHNRLTRNLISLIDDLVLADFAPSTSATAPSGSILYRIPHTMRVAQDYKCVVRLSFDDKTILEGIVMTEDTVLKPIRVSEVMEVELIDPNETPAFSLRQVNSVEQFLVKDAHTQWIFYAKPLRTGELPLMLKVAVKERIHDQERRREIVLEEIIQVVAEAEKDEQGEIGFTNAGYTIYYSMAPSATHHTGGFANSDRRRFIVPLMAVLMVAISIWAAGTYLGWFDPAPVYPNPDKNALRQDSMDWRAALYQDIDTAYWYYLRQHPNGLFKDSAYARLAALDKIPKDTTHIPPRSKSSSGNTKKNPPTSTRKSGFEMVWVEGGSYTMGKGHGDECEHKVKVRSFNIGKYEVTQADWEEIMGDNPSSNKGCPECPVEQVTWDQVQEFIKKASRNGKTYRLPLEKEWEYAARGGKAKLDYRYAGSNHAHDVAWFEGGLKETSKVGLKSKIKELDIYDMSGNVREWCSDIWGPYPCKQGKNKLYERVIRGGAWAQNEKKLSVYGRQHLHQSKKDYITGFRLVQD